MLTEQAQELIKLVRTSASNDTKKQFTKLATLTDDQILKFFFKRSAEENTHSLTYGGLKVLKNFFRSWEIPLQSPLTGKQHLILIRHCKLPYYINSKKIVVFEREVGVILTLSHGNNEYIEDMFPG